MFFLIYVFLFTLDGDGSDEYTRTKYFIRSLFLVSKLDQKRRDYLFFIVHLQFHQCC